MYSFDSRVRYSEVDCNQNMTYASLLNYLQDCCSFQSEELGVGVDFLKEKKAAWMLASWQVVMVRAPKFCEHITISTWPYDFGGFYGYRNFKVEDDHGNIIAYANSIWVFVDMVSGRPTKIDPKMIEVYPIDEKLDMEYAGRKIPKPKIADMQKPITVTTSMIDTNHHMNNEKYIEIAQGFLPEDFEIRQMRAEYKKAAVLGDEIYPYISIDDTQSAIIVTLADEKARPYAIMEFKGVEK